MLLPLQLNNLLPPPAGAMVGTSSITFGSSAAPTLSVSASSSLTFADSALLGGTFPLTGSSSITFSPAGSITDSSAPVEVKRQTGGRARKRKRYVVEIDGEFFEVSSIYEAQSVLAQARALAEQVAETAVQSVPDKVRIKPPRVSLKTASGAETTSATLQQDVRRTQEAISRIYRDAQKRIEVNREISRLIHKRLEDEDEEEAILALLM